MQKEKKCVDLLAFQLLIITIYLALLDCKDHTFILEDIFKNRKNFTTETEIQTILFRIVKTSFCAKFQFSIFLNWACQNCQNSHDSKIWESKISILIYLGQPKWSKFSFHPILMGKISIAGKIIISKCLDCLDLDHCIFKCPRSTCKFWLL